jgi:hypothetical protein
VESVIQLVLQFRPLHLGAGGDARLRRLTLVGAGERVDPLEHQVRAILELLDPNDYSFFGHAISYNEGSTQGLTGRRGFGRVPGGPSRFLLQTGRNLCR